MLKFFQVHSIMASKPVAIYELESDEGRYFSPFCWAARFALIHKGLKFKTEPWHFQEQEKIKFSNQGLVRECTFLSSYMFHDLSNHSMIS